MPSKTSPESPADKAAKDAAKAASDKAAKDAAAKAKSDASAAISQNDEAAAFVVESQKAPGSRINHLGAFRSQEAAEEFAANYRAGQSEPPECGNVFVRAK